MIDGFYLREPSFFANTQNVFFYNTDFQLLSFFKLMSVVFGDFQTFFKVLQTLKSSNEVVDYMGIENVVLFLVLNNHIAVRESDDIFVSKFYDNADHLIGMNWPFPKLIGMNFIFDLKWSVHNKYNSSESYFKEARVLNKNPMSTTGGKSGINVQTSHLFEVLEECIVASYKKGWFSKAGIAFEII